VKKKQELNESKINTKDNVFLSLFCSAASIFDSQKTNIFLTLHITLLWYLV